MKYCESISKTLRRPTREVKVGHVGVGGSNPIRIQSMTTSSTRDVDATVEQIIKLADAGCEIARVTVQGIKEADACEHIKNTLVQKGYNIPIVADIHFFPPAAMRVADFVDKIRINPGNFVDKRASFKVIEYDDASYALELEKIEEKFTPLVEKCKKLKRAMRIGTNHGSLSDRIMNRYGDTPQGMLESALEFARLCRKNDYHDFIFSMKSSNPQVMVQAYRLLAAEMYKLGWDYPLHLGVTEAGQGEDGRIKSAMGIGALLLDGIGDTIRVSLTEDAWHEIDPCRRLIRFAEEYEAKSSDHFFEEKFRDFMLPQKREVHYPRHISMHKSGTVIVSVPSHETGDLHKKLGCDLADGKVKLTASSVDCIYALESERLNPFQEAGISLLGDVLSIKEAFTEKQQKTKKEKFALKIAPVSPDPFAIRIEDGQSNEWDLLKELQPSMILLHLKKNRLHAAREFFEWIKYNQLTTPVILNFSYDCSPDDLVIHASAECGALLCDGLGEGVWIQGPYEIGFLRNLSFGILQAARMRMSKTDFISCPSCGRTLFDLQEVTKRIKERTAHLPGVKIAIMGCIVNGPGEMADADFGYVGSKPGMIDLYVGKNCVEKDISFDEADNRLIDLIKAHGRWQDPS